MILLLLLLSCSSKDPGRHDPGSDSLPPGDSTFWGDSEGDSLRDSTSDSELEPGSPQLAAPAHLALPFVTAGDPVPRATFTLSNLGDLPLKALEFEIEGDFGIEGAPEALAPGASVEVEVLWSGGTDAAALGAGRLRISSEELTWEMTLAAVVGHPDLPDATFTEELWGASLLVSLPSAPFPEGAPYDTVLVFVPARYGDQGDVGVVTHLHGHNAHVEELLETQFERELLLASGREAILILPQGPYEAASGDFGQLASPGGHLALVKDAVALAYREGLVTHASLGPQVLTSHSGGYLATAAIVESGGLPIHGVHLFDSLYGEEAIYADFARDGGLLRSVWTDGGGTSTENQDLARDLADLGVSSSFDDDDLERFEITIGRTGSSHGGCVTDGRAYGRWLAHAGLARAGRAPPELRLAVVECGMARVEWAPDAAGEGQIVLLEGSRDGLSWEELSRDDRGPLLGEALPFLRLRSQDSAAYPSDVVGATGQDWLVVDGFDRFLDGSWGLTEHDFTARLGVALGAGFSSASDEAIVAGQVDLLAYDHVLWLLGDESSADEPFSDAAEALIQAYLEGGGHLLLTGSELGYADRSFLSGLGVDYVSDDAGTDRVEGWTFGVVYEEDYPDVLSGDSTLWRYATGGGAAVSAWEGRLAVVGFGLETMEDRVLGEALPALVAALGW